MTAQALAEHLEVSERTIYRDIEALSFAGILLYTERGPGGGCELLDGYQTRLTGLTTLEVRALFLLSISPSLADLGLDQALENALLKLSAVLPANSRENATRVRQRIHMETTQPTHSRTVLSHLERIQEAIWQDYTLYLTYKGEHKHFIDPYGLVSQRGTWYLVGASAGAMHVMCVTHIQSIELTKEHFTRPTEFDLAAYWTERDLLINHFSAGGRGSQALKKAKMKADLPTRMSPQRGIHTALAQNKKKAFYLQNIWLRFVSDLSPTRKEYWTPTMAVA